ncbi:MAG: hypothetical protein LBL07_08660 [Tannerella sp.]|nr:hypothetical protein [Tannerella sp.]
MTSICVITGSSCGKENRSDNEGEPKDDPEVIATPVSFSFVSNQCGGNVWYRPGGTIVNAHLDESFGNRDLWPKLIDNLKRCGGSFSIYATEIGYMSSVSGLLPILKSEGIPVSIEMPGFTQCITGKLLGEAELNGKPVNGANIFSSIFTIRNPADRTDPDGKGWFVTKDRQPFIPDEILFDERMPNLLPQFDANRLAGTAGTWEERKNAAKINNGCAVSMGDYDVLLSTLMQDYVDFLNVAKAKWGDKMPDVGIHWNVVVGWDWRDQKGLDAIYSQNPNYFNSANNFYMVWQYSQYNSVEYLNNLIDLLDAAGFKPRTVYMDVDWTYSIPYVTEVLKRHAVALKTKGVQLGINVVEASLQDNEELFYNGLTLMKRTVNGTKPNELYENTLIAIAQFLKGSGIYEKGVQIRVGSWSHRPYETGTQINENTTGSMAHTANSIVTLLGL